MKKIEDHLDPQQIDDRKGLEVIWIVRIIGILSNLRKVRKSVSLKKLRKASVSRLRNLASTRKLL